MQCWRTRVWQPCLLGRGRNVCTCDCALNVGSLCSAVPLLHEHPRPYNRCVPGGQDSLRKLLLFEPLALLSLGATLGREERLEAVPLIAGTGWRGLDGGGGGFA